MTLTVLHEKLPLTGECHHYDALEEVPHDIQKYWHQRYSIFEFYDYDIRLTDSAWFGVTPEPVAMQIAHTLHPPIPFPTSHPSPSPSAPHTLLDIFSGAGGNVIAFALSEKYARIIAIERDPVTLACAQHNAEVYGVLDSITWVLGDSFEFLRLAKTNPSSLPEEIRIDFDTTTVFASPPWGGVDYKDQDVFDLSTMAPYNLRDIYEACTPMAQVLFLPRTSDVRQIAELVEEGEKVNVVQYCMYGASKAMVAYLPAGKKGGGSA